jgi:hypothetical protein
MEYGIFQSKLLPCVCLPFPVRYPVRHTHKYTPHTNTYHTHTNTHHTQTHTTHTQTHTTHKHTPHTHKHTPHTNTHHTPPHTRSHSHSYRHTHTHTHTHSSKIGSSRFYFRWFTPYDVCSTDSDSVELVRFNFTMTVYATCLRRAASWPVKAATSVSRLAPARAYVCVRVSPARRERWSIICGRGYGCYTYSHTYIHTYMHACIHAHTHTCTHMHTPARLCVEKYPHEHVDPACSPLG